MKRNLFLRAKIKLLPSRDHPDGHRLPSSLQVSLGSIESSTRNFFYELVVSIGAAHLIFDYRANGAIPGHTTFCYIFFANRRYRTNIISILPSWAVTNLVPLLSCRLHYLLHRNLAFSQENPNIKKPSMEPISWKIPGSHHEKGVTNKI